LSSALLRNEVTQVSKHLSTRLLYMLRSRGRAPGGCVAFGGRGKGKTVSDSNRRREAENAN
jgi:hypothetical protein